MVRQQSSVSRVRNCSGLVPFRKKRGQLQVLVVRSSSSGRWVFPKGGLERGLNAQENAIKEAYEEGGIVVSLIEDTPPMSLPYSKAGYHGYVLYYLARTIICLDAYPEVGSRRRKWVSISKGAKLLDQDQQQILGFFKKVIKDVSSVQV